MKEKLFAGLISVLLISGCGKESLDEQHEQFLSGKGWKAEELIEEQSYMLDISDDMLSNYEASGIAFLRDHAGEEVTEFVYELKEEDAAGEHLKAVVFEAEEEIIGGFGILPSWTPGRFSLDAKDQLIEEEMIKP